MSDIPTINTPPDPGGLQTTDVSKGGILRLSNPYRRVVDVHWAKPGAIQMSGSSPVFDTVLGGEIFDGPRISGPKPRDAAPTTQLTFFLWTSVASLNPGGQKGFTLWVPNGSDGRTTFLNFPLGLGVTSAVDYLHDGDRSLSGLAVLWPDPFPIAAWPTTGFVASGASVDVAAGVGSQFISLSELGVAADVSVTNGAPLVNGLQELPLDVGAWGVYGNPGQDNTLVQVAVIPRYFDFTLAANRRLLTQPCPNGKLIPKDLASLDPLLFLWGAPDRFLSNRIDGSAWAAVAGTTVGKVDGPHC